jgi:hypothetical protein
MNLASMIRKTSISVSLLLFFVSSLYAQQESSSDRILFRGVVLSASSGERLAGSRYYINKSISGLTRDDGTFSFFASRHDTIVFDMLGYKASSLVVLDSLKSREFLTGVYLQSDTIQIGEVVVIPSLSALKAEMMNPERQVDQKMDNARSNLNIASYQGRVSQGKIGDPYSNYEVLRQQQKTDAYEKGQVPSSRIVGINPFMLLPAAYLLLHGLPEKPSPPNQGISSKELNDLNKKYNELLMNKK